MSVPWSPSRAREAARAALCRYRTGTASDELVALVAGLLAEDRVFDSPDALLAAMTGPVPRELLAVLRERAR